MSEGQKAEGKMVKPGGKNEEHIAITRESKIVEQNGEKPACATQRRVKKLIRSLVKQKDAHSDSPDGEATQRENRLYTTDSMPSFTVHLFFISNEQQGGWGMEMR